MVRLRHLFFLILVGLAAAPAVASAGTSVQQSADTGFLAIASTPSAKIAIDGQDTGLMTPQAKITVPVGRHKLTLETPDGKNKKSIDFIVRKGETTRLNFSF
jgi:hypothetical protein